jgi:membrane protease YdiL (CAAX protease family)
MDSSSCISDVGVYCKEFFSVNERQATKVVLVALAALSLVVFQTNLPVITGVAVGVGLGFLTLVFEKYVRAGSELDRDWLDVSKIDRWHLLGCLCFYSVVIPALSAFATPVGAAPVAQGIGWAIRSGDIGLIFTACLLGPCSEEILFRGFLQERIEDLVYMTRKWTCVSVEITQDIANLVQAVLFGGVHILGKQVMKSTEKGVVWLMTGACGWYWGHTKNKECLLSSIALHSMHNASSTINILMSDTF